MPTAFAILKKAEEEPPFTKQETGRNAMTAGRLRFVGPAVSLCLALMLAAASIWTASAESAPKPKPVPEDRTANIQLLGVNDFHGNLESPRTLARNGAQVPVGGAAYLGAYLNQYEA